MRKKMFLVITLSLLALTACLTTSSETSVSTYRVNKSTGLYASLDVDADQIAVLSVGTELIPADGKTSLVCNSIVESGMTFNLCKVEVVSTGRSGWVLRQWID